MIYQTYGQTGIDVSAIGFGGMRFRDQKNVDECAGLVKYAYDKGVNYFDTAPGYGESELLFGEAFKEMAKNRTEKPFYVSTKTFAQGYDNVIAACETSLERMGVDSIDFYHMWCVLNMEAYDKRKEGETLRAFERLKEQGLVKHIVVSSHMTGSDIGILLRDYPFEGVLLGYSVMNFAYREAALDAAAELGRGVVVMNPLGGGMIPQHPELFDFVKTRENDTAVQGALKFLLNDPRITIALVGFSETAHVDEAVAATETFEPLSDEQVTTIRARLKNSFNALCTGCGYCDTCPQGIPVPKMMDAYNQYALTGNSREAINRLNWHWGIKADSDIFGKCVECGLCEAACTQKLNICERLRFLKTEAETVVAQNEAKK